MNEPSPITQQLHPHTLEICRILALAIERRRIKQEENNTAEREGEHWTSPPTRACMSHRVQRQESNNE